MVSKFKNAPRIDFKKFFDLYSPEKNSGKILAIIGPASSGKSMILGALAGLVPLDKAPNQGNRDNRTNSFSGYLPQFLPFYRNSCLKKELEFIASTRKISADDSLKVLINAFNAEDVYDTPFKKINNNILQKAGIIQAFINFPDLVLLDEPLNRMDQEGVSEFIRFLQIYKSQYLRNASLIITSTKLLYLWEIVDEIIFIRSDKEFIRLTPGEIKGNFSVYEIPVDQCDQLIQKYPNLIYRKTGKDSGRVMLTNAELKKIKEIESNEKSAVELEDIYHYYCVKNS